ncbi:GNAT family N-acetyltransferase [Lactiplantibacillus herbarum]|uniref:GNAT family N-acetyltransferase n=1 Tax=Lactiplantibacillus herbarum TaxID=1670446 RepID=UPI00064F74A9|nr:GNAT family N-acetyltransferase [Lactiplantibacillus herbarum]
MSQFEKYHPLLTPHYAFDWLTKNRVIDVFNLYQSIKEPAITMETTAALVNDTMRAIFSDQQLVWGVTDKATDDFVGQVGFTSLNLDQHAATVKIAVVAAYHRSEPLTEILQRLISFGTLELKLQHLTVTIPVMDKLVEQVLTGLNFTTTDHLTFNFQQ